MKPKTVGMIFHPPSLEAIEKEISLFQEIDLNLFSKLDSYSKFDYLLDLSPFKILDLKNLNFNGVPINFIGIMLPLLPRQLIKVEDYNILNRIIAAVNLAEKNGVEIVTLGAFTSIVSNQGEDIYKKVNIPVTSGNTFTATLIINSILELCKNYNIDMTMLRLGIIGATGNIGSASAKYLLKKFKKINLCSRNINSQSAIVSIISKDIIEKPSIYNDPLDLIKNSDVIICSASNMEAIIDIKDISDGKIICDTSVPSFFKTNIKDLSKGIFIFDGGRAQFGAYENIKDSFWKTLFPINSVYGCLMESFILGLSSKIKNYSIGNKLIDSQKIDELYSLARDFKIEIANFSFNGNFYSQDNVFTRLKNIKSYV